MAISQDEKTVGEVVRELESDYRSDVHLSEYVSFNQGETIDKIDAYLFSKHWSGDTDSLGRDKPFFNIVTAAVNIWYRATDLDRKHIRLKPTNHKNVVPAFLATVILQNWMRQVNFGMFLNEWGRTLAKYCSAVPEFVEKDGELIPSILTWNRTITDPVDFDNNPVIKILDLTEAQLRKDENYDQAMVDALIDAEQTRRDREGHNIDQRSGYYRLYEVHGEFSMAQLKMAQGKEPTEADYDNFCHQMHVISYVGTRKGRGKNAKTEYQDFTLYAGKEENPHMITHLIKEDGRTLGIGAVEYLFDAQWMQNHSVKGMKDQLDLANKLIFQTADGSFINQNALMAIETGDILIHELNMPITQVNNQSHDITSTLNFQNQWKALGQELTSTPDAMRGANQPANTPYSSVALQVQQGNSLFELMTENKGLYLEEMLRRFVIPHLKKKLDNKEEIVAVLEDHDIKKLDSLYVPKAAIERYNRKAAQQLIKGEIPEAFDPTIMEGEVQNELNTQGNTRFIDPEDIAWKQWLKDVDWDAIEVEITDEQVDKNAVYQTLNTLLQFFAAKQGMPLTDDERLIVNKILIETGRVSPIELSQAKADVPAAAPQPGAADPMAALAEAMPAAPGAT